MEKEKLDKQLDHLEKSFKAGLISEEEYNDSKKKIQDKVTKVSEKISEEEKKKKAIKEILKKPKKATPKAEPKKAKKPKAPKKEEPEKKIEPTPIVQEPKKEVIVEYKEESSVWGYILLLIVIVGILFLVYQYTPAPAPLSKTITIHEYSDVFCPYSNELQPELIKVKQSFAKNVEIYHKHYPNKLNPMSLVAAEALECANEQRRFAEFHVVLVKNIDEVTKMENFVELAAQVGDLDPVIFQSCLEDHKMLQNVMDDIEAGEALGIQSTPALVIDGEVFEGYKSSDEINCIVSSKLKQ